MNGFLSVVLKQSISQEVNLRAYIKLLNILKKEETYKHYVIQKIMYIQGIYERDPTL